MSTAVAKVPPLKKGGDRNALATVIGEIAFARRSVDEDAPEVEAPLYDAGAPQVAYNVEIRDARPIVGELSLDKEGFVLVPHTISCADVRDPEILSRRYLEEMVPFIKDYFGASLVVPRRDGVVVRRASASPPPGVRPASYNAHIDYAPISAVFLAADENQLQGLPNNACSRMMIVQAWRALSPPPQDFPLALADASTIPQADLCEHTFVSHLGKSHRSICLHHSKNVHWYYFTDMHADEVVLFTGYDSSKHYGPCSAHSAFDNRSAFPGANPRESIEARFYVYFD